jgi:hypothetical protein
LYSVQVEINITDHLGDFAQLRSWLLKTNSAEISAFEASQLAPPCPPQSHAETELLVGGWPTPLKNDGVRQLGWWHSQDMESHNPVMFQSPPTRYISIVYPCIVHISYLYYTINGIIRLPFRIGWETQLLLQLQLARSKVQVVPLRSWGHLAACPPSGQRLEMGLLSQNPWLIHFYPKITW